MSQATEDTWYYSAGTERKGPYPASEVKALVDAGTLDDQTLFWTAGMANWVPLRETPFASRTSPPPFSRAPPPALQPASASMGDGPQPLGFTDAISLCFRNYVTFSGRAGRSEFWYFMLFIFVAGIVASILDRASFGGQSVMPINAIFTLAVILPELGVSVRRLHDTDRSGWWVLFSLVPLIGIITLIVFCCQKGTQGRNRFG